MNELAVIDQKSSGLSIPDATVHLMQSELAESTRLRYKRISKADKRMARWSDVE